MQFISKRQKLIILIISIIQIAGGITGLFLIAYLLWGIETITGPNLLIIFIGIALFIFSTYCGKLLLTNKDKRSAIILSIINQALQIFQFSMLGLGFTYSSGINFALGMKVLALDFNLSVITSSFSMYINSDNPFYFKINFAAVALMCLLIEIYNRPKKLDESTVIENQSKISDLYGKFEFDDEANR